MKKINTSDISTGVGMPIKSGSIEHLQSAYAEALDYVTRNIVGNYDASKMYIVNGCVNSTSGTTYTISAGAIFYNGEIYLVNATTFTTALLAVCNLDTSYFSATNADPVNFTDGIDRNVHEIRKIKIEAASSGLVNFSDCVRLDWQTSYSTGLVTVTAGSATISSCRLRYKKQGDTVILNYVITLTIASYSSSLLGLSIPPPFIADVQNNGFDLYAMGIFAPISTSEPFNCKAVIDYTSPFADPLLNLTVYNSITGAATISGQIIYPTTI